MRRRRLWRGLVAGVLVTTGIIVAAGYWLLNPPRHAPGPADAVFVLAGQTDGRHDLGVELVEAGHADNLVVSNPAGARDKAGSATCRGDRRPEGARTWCLKPTPVTTAGEAMTFQKLADREGWTSVNVVTNRPHTHRVRMIFDQCTNLDVTVVTLENLYWQRVPYHIARELGGFIKHWISDPCGVR